jgi:hypothetical protein
LPPNTPASPTVVPCWRTRADLRRGFAGFGERIQASLNDLDFDGRQSLVRLVFEDRDLARPPGPATDARAARGSGSPGDARSLSIGLDMGRILELSNLQDV